MAVSTEIPATHHTEEHRTPVSVPNGWKLQGQRRCPKGGEHYLHDGLAVKCSMGFYAEKFYILVDAMCPMERAFRTLLVDPLSEGKAVVTAFRPEFLIPEVGWLPLDQPGLNPPTGHAVELQVQLSMELRP